MCSFLVLASSLLSFALASVKFPSSLILQQTDIAGTGRINFQCKSQCKVYVDRKSDALVITQKGIIIADFNKIVGDNGYAPTGNGTITLTAGDDYYLENIGNTNMQFVMYVVATNSPNFGSSVFVPQETVGVIVNGKDRFATILSSLEAMWFSGFNGTFPPGYPRIYAAPFDAGLDKCRPVYQARSQYNAEQSWPTIASAVFTIDFGFTGDHRVSVNYGKIKDMTKNGASTTVYTSPGYVGCDSAAGQNYYSALNQVQDSFSLQSGGLNVDAAYSLVTSAEPVQFTVSNKKNNFVGTDNYSDHFDKGTFDVSISWTRSTPSSSFAIQLDFGNGISSLSSLSALALVFAACLW